MESKKNEHKLDALGVNRMQHNLIGFLLLLGASFFQTRELCNGYFGQLAAANSSVVVS
jgi:hypothetical protein